MVDLDLFLQRERLFTQPRDRADCDPAYDLLFHDFHLFSCRRARPRSQQLILFSLGF